MVNLTADERLAREHLCFPLDDLLYLLEEDEVDGAISLERRVKQLSPFIKIFKIGMGSYTRFGHGAINVVKENGSDFFLDLKFKDIENTVKDASAAAVELGAYMFNVHASGGYKMMEAAVEGAHIGAERSGNPLPKILGVTVLTSQDEAEYLRTFQPVNPALEGIDFEQYVGVKKSDEELYEEFQDLLDEYDLRDIIQEQVSHLADLSYKAGLDGVVCSPAELKALKKTQLPDGFVYTTPGVKGLTGAAGSDQNKERMFTPGNALKAGSDYLVMGRGITEPLTPEQKAAGVEVTPAMVEAAAYDALKDMAPYVRQVA